jgi:hypothetical protein
MQFLSVARLLSHYKVMRSSFERPEHIVPDSGGNVPQPMHIKSELCSHSKKRTQEKLNGFISLNWVL